jgi:large subunit GTPase 1
LVVQIVDARNPLFFRSQDLENYVKESDERKKNLLLINKSDLLTLNQRKTWAEYLTEKGIRYAFFSASTALREVESDDNGNNDNKDEQDSEEESPESSESDNGIYDKEPEQESESINGNYAIMNSDPTRVLTVDQLEDLFLSEAPEPLNAEDRIQIGLVGYPNVGKSSTINALIGAKKVSVSSTPGKTKHFQTILLTPKVMLCDCPGLVFPNFASTNAELVCNGVLPIDQLREHTSPVNLVTLRIPKFFLEAIYGISIHTRPVDEGGDGMPTAEELLVAYARARGFMRSGQGSPDESRAARFILKDYVNAKLLYCQPPPNYGDREQFNSQLYKYSALPEARRNQIFAAIKSSRPEITESDLDSIDLATELSNLKFSQHDPTTSMLSPYGIAANSSALLPDLPTAGGDLDKEFFAQRQNNGITSMPFHLKSQQSGNSKKKHFKMNKNKKKNGEVSYD